MQKAKIFIASSGRTKTLAEKLAIELETEFCSATDWSKEGRRRPGITIIEMLETAAETYDFAVIILARDDVMVVGDGDILKARDNCVFEAGLFIAALGRERCFLVNSVKHSELPSDLGGIISLPFQEPGDLSNRDECGDAIKSAASDIKDAVQPLGRRRERPLSQDELLERERLIGTDSVAELVEDQVVVLSVQPVELNYEPARQVRNNIVNGGIQYVYLLQGSPDGAKKVCKLLQMILLAPFLEHEPAAKFADRGAKMRQGEVQDQVLGTLKRISQQGGIKAFFLPARPTLQYCIHNAGSDTAAVLYLKRDEYFIKWAERQDAYQFWVQERETAYRISERLTAIFNPAPKFDIGDADFKSALKTAILRYFPGIADEVERVCLEGAGR